MNDDLWLELNDTLEGAIDAVTGALETTKGRLTAPRRSTLETSRHEFHGVRVELQAHRTWLGGPTPTPRHRATVLVHVPMPGAARLSAWIEPGRYHLLGLGRQDEVLGHRGFDDAFLVKTGDGDALRFWLGPDELAALQTTHDPDAADRCTVELDGGALRWRGSVDTTHLGELPPRTREALKAAAYVAGRAGRLATAWRTRGADLGLVAHGDHFDVDGGFALRAARRVPIEVVFPDALPGVRRRGLRTVVRAPRSSPSPAVGALWRDTLSRADRPAGAKLRDGFTIGTLHGHDAGGPWLEATLAPYAAQLAAAAPDAVTVTESTVELRWERYVDDVARLAAALDLVEHIAAPPPTGAGPYR